MELSLVQFIAGKLAAHDCELNQHQEPEDFYVGLAEVAVRAFTEHETRPRHKPDRVEGLIFLGAEETL